MEFFMPNAMIGFSPESNWVTSKLPLVGGGNGHLRVSDDGPVYGSRNVRIGKSRRNKTQSLRSWCKVVYDFICAE